MRGTHQVTMGDRGRLVIPTELRERAGLRPGRKLVIMETDNGLLLLTREQLREVVRVDLQGHDLVEELLSDRRAEAVADELAIGI